MRVITIVILIFSFIITLFLLQVLIYTPKVSLDVSPSNIIPQINKPYKDNDVNENIEPIKLTDEEILLRPKIYPIPKPSIQRKFKIGVVPIPGSKLPELPTHSNIQFIPLPLSARSETKYWPNMGYYISLFGFEYRTETKEQYPFNQYQEDVTFVQDYYTFSKTLRKNVDLIFIAPIGIKLDSAFANNLYEFINSAIEETPNFCILQTYMSKAEREQNQIHGSTYKLKVNWPKYSYKQLGGLITTPEIFSRMPHFLFSTHYLNRFDIILQHYCEVVDDPIIVSPYNLFSIPNGAFN
ncbi:hypothetical protein EDI_106650 [Entamoeba dispar SAW760]|uniref:Uncharacterized protein n=1 Tax=Entamoeba dispar (strain ATCC PRA-260 / SAW760) TaxID=370354 RepID=B0ET43_ENTDS|nr:uncharacterized protein EDI_106650 [Entamoeba dispar SAW760]EDR22296.1 hypothetical protein EDI_106650 [Entamoeba dispar SAW760]|eukprot:EDR22296.1 hypothetical protein EDI_106650 [Entamoeba dispar SAW760]